MKRIGSLIVLLVVAVVLVGCSVSIITPDPGADSGDLRGYVYIREGSQFSALSEGDAEILFSAQQNPPYGYEPLADATVRARNTRTGKTTLRTTDADGHFYFRDLEVGSYTVTISHSSLRFDVVESNVAVLGSRVNWLSKDIVAGIGYYIVIGIDRYQDGTQVFGPVADAEAVYETLFRQNRLAGLGRLLLNSDARKSQIKQAINEAVTMANSSSDPETNYLVIYFSGLSNQDILRPWDSDGRNWFTDITDTELESWVSAFPGNVTLIVDGADSESMADGTPFRPYSLRTDWRYTVLAGAHNGEMVNYNHSLGNSVFTHFLLKGITTRAAEQGPSYGEITAYELYEYAKEEMYWYYNRNTDTDYHVPYFYEGSYGDTVIFRY